MNILFVLPEYLHSGGGGISTYYSALLPALANAGHSVRVVYGSNTVSEAGGNTSQANGITSQLLDANLVSKYLRLFGRYEIAPKLARHLAATWGLWEQAQRGPQADLVEVTDFGLNFVPWLLEPHPPLLVQLLGSIGQIAVQTPFHGEELAESLIQLIELRGLAAADQLQASSMSTARYWERHLDRHVDVVRPIWHRPEGIGTPNGDRTSRGLVVGRVQLWKGPHVLCEALRLMGKDAPSIDWVGRDVPLSRAGDSTSRYLSDTWPDVWGSRIRWLPQETHPNILQRQQSAGFVLVPSVWDVFNMTCVEAMSAGTPVVCSSAVGASELIDSGTSGCVFKSEDASDLAQSLGRVTSMPQQQRDEMGSAAAAAIRKTLSVDAVLPRRLELYRKLSAKGAANKLADDDWLCHICRPSHSPSSPTLDDCLDGLPLRKLLRYSTGRLLAKAFRQ
jgi:glycosyltransferase involved in cell wall biosynthesis